MVMRSWYVILWCLAATWKANHETLFNSVCYLYPSLLYRKMQSHLCLFQWRCWLNLKCFAYFWVIRYYLWLRCKVFLLVSWTPYFHLLSHHLLLAIIFKECILFLSVQHSIGGIRVEGLRHSASLWTLVRRVSQSVGVLTRVYHTLASRFSFSLFLTCQLELL